MGALFEKDPRMVGVGKKYRVTQKTGTFEKPNKN